MARKSRKNTESIAVSQQPPIIKEAFNVAGYVRLSAVDKKHKGDSIETQQAIISAFIDERPDLELREIYIDNGLSGQTFERPAFQRMIADMESGKINCCVTKDLSRLGRNAIDAGFYIERFFPSHGVRFIAITDDFDSAVENSSCILVSLKNMINEAYALEIGRKIRNTKQMHIRNGCFVGRIPPYGYLKNPKDNHRLVPDPYAAQIVLKMFTMASAGDSIKTIAKWLNDNGILPTKRYFHSIGLATEKEASGHIHWNKAFFTAYSKTGYIAATWFRVNTVHTVMFKKNCPNPSGLLRKIPMTAL
jgi:DNA invertase Pin-like site-specific DNA recombinase